MGCATRPALCAVAELTHPTRLRTAGSSVPGLGAGGRPAARARGLTCGLSCSSSWSVARRAGAGSLRGLRLLLLLMSRSVAGSARLALLGTHLLHLMTWRLARYTLSKYGRGCSHDNSSRKRDDHCFHVVLLEQAPSKETEWTSARSRQRTLMVRPALLDWSLSPPQRDERFSIRIGARRRNTGKLPPAASAPEDSKRSHDSAVSRMVCRARHNFSFAHALCLIAARPILPKDRTASH
ncbi:hypothetical protein ABIA45_002121 [Bradyrhizobium sp. USDA 336]